MFASHEQSKAITGQAIDLKPNSFPPWVNLGTVYALNGDFVLAERSLGRATELAERESNKDFEKASADAWRNRASLQLFLRKTGAAKNISHAIERNPADVASRVMHARILLASADDALEFEEALDEAKYADTLLIELGVTNFHRCGCDFIFRITQAETRVLVALAKFSFLSFDYQLGKVVDAADGFKEFFSN